MDRPADHPEIPAARVGMLIVNLGTPDAPDPAAVKRYLGEFLSDRRVVEIPPIAWQPILRGIILNTRPKKSAEAYRQIWTEAGSPLAAITGMQAGRLAERLGEGVMVRHAMRYGKPALGQEIAEMKAAGCERLLIAPLYPQYSGATTATVMDEAFRALMQMRWQPAIRSLPPYYDDAAYIDALAIDVERHLGAIDFVPDVLLASFHGMPERTLKLGDPYHCHCRKTARLLAKRLGRDVMVSFQSRFGRARWLEPATDTVLEKLGRDHLKVAVTAPGFSADCLETLEELSIRGREQFLGAGGDRFAYLPCLNADDTGTDMLETLARRELAGWI